MLMMLGAPTLDGQLVLPEEIHARYAPPSAVLRKMATMLFRGAAGIFLIPEEMILEAWEEELSNEAAHEGNMPQQVYEPTHDPAELDAVRQALIRLGAKSGNLAA